MYTVKLQQTITINASISNISNFCSLVAAKFFPGMTQKSIKIYVFLFLSFLALCLFSCLSIYQLSTSVIKLTNFQILQNFRIEHYLLYLCQNLAYDSGSLSYSMEFSVIISIINITLAIKFPGIVYISLAAQMW